MCAALLAAGGGSRFTGPTHKLLAPMAHDGRPVWRAALDAVLASTIDRLVLVTGAVELELPHDAATSGRVVVRRNEHWADGQATSLVVAVEQAREWGVDALLLGLADQPLVPPSAWDAIAATDPGCRLAIATYDGRPGPHPVRIAAELWPSLPRSGDAGARDLLAAQPGSRCEVPCLGSAADIDTVEDLERWTSW